MTDPLIIAGTKLASRLFVGTAGYPNQQVLLDSLEASGAEIVTASIRRISLEGYAESLVDLLGSRYRILPNTSGCVTARDAILTAELARELAERHLLVNYRDEYGGGWSHPLIGAEDNAPVDRLEELGHDRFIIGGPEQCVATIKRFQETFGVDHLICRMYFPGMSHEHIMRGLELLATEVMPAFRD